MQVDGHNKKSEKSDPLFDQLSTEELERLLRTPDGTEPDIDFILKVMEVIQSREDETDTQQPDVDNAWKEFQENYQGQADAYAISLPQEPEPRSGKQNRRMPRALRWVAILAAVLLLLCGTASAFGMNIFQAIADWTAETFRFTSAQSGDMVQAVPEEDVYADLRKVVAEYTNSTVIPMWSPEGAELAGEVRVTERVSSIGIRASYKTDQGEVLIHIRIYDQPPTSNVITYQKDETSVEKYEAGGITHYIMSNLDTVNVVWVTGNIECYIQGNLSTNDAKQMIESIYRD